MNNVPFIPRNRAGRKLHNLARRHVRDDHDLRAAVYEALAARNGSVEGLGRDWKRPAVDTRRRSTPPTLADQEHESETMMSSSKGTPANVPIPLHERRWLREALKIAAAAVLFGIIGALLALALRGNDPEQPVVVPGVGPTPTVTSTPAPSSTVTARPTENATADAAATRQVMQEIARQALTATVEAANVLAAASATANASLPSPGKVVSATRVGSNPIALAVAGGNLWVGNTGDGTVSRIDPATNEVVATIGIGPPNERGGTPWFVVAYDEQIWATDQNAMTILQIDPTTNAVVKTIPLLNADGAGSFVPQGLVVDESGIWVSDYDGGRLVHIDRDTGAVLATIDIARPQDIAAGFGSLWIGSFGRTGAAVVRVDPASNQILDTVGVTGDTGFVATGADAVWVSDERSGTVTRIDPTTNTVVATIDTGLREARYVLVAFDKVWVNGWLGMGFDNGMLTIDPATNELSGFIDTLPGISWFMTAFDGSVWVAHADAGEVVRVDPAQ
jgi:YVTN family beta-propeller protein